MNTISTTSEVEIQVTRSASCPTISGRGTIVMYEVGSIGDCQYF